VPAILCDSAPVIETIQLNWSEPKTVNTRVGIRTLRTAAPTPAFWNAWRSSKNTLKNEGVSCSKNDRDGTWEICLWGNGATSDETTNPTNPQEQAQVPSLSGVDGSVPAQSSNVSGASTGTDSLSAGVEGSIPSIPTVFWSAEQEEIFQWFASGTGNAVVQARAGTGKTTTIKQAFTFVPSHITKLLYAVFNKKNQIEAEEKISDKRVEIKTLHSLGFFYITQVWPGVKPDASVEAARIEAVSPNIPEEVLGCVERIVGFAKNLLLNPTVEQLIDIANDRGIFSAAEAEADGGWTVAKLAKVAFDALEAAKERDNEGRISFNDMVWLPVVKNWVFPRFGLVVVDESQDMNLPQLEMAIRSCEPGGRICIVGDDRQAIYAFRGAAQNGMRMMQERLSARVFGLTTTYRCPKAVVAIAAEIVTDYKAAPSAPEGLVDEVVSVLEHARIGDAILSRLNAPLMSACLNLLRRGTPARIEGRDIGAQLVGMVRKLRAKSVPDFIRKLEAWGTKQRARFGATKNAEAKIAQVNDQVDTLMAVSEGARNVAEIESKIYSLFQDTDSNAKPSVVLSSVHKAKGLEWNRVFILTATFKKNKGDEEQNIYYVAVTRAKKHLTFVG